jgi:hypothetical protein
VLTIQSMPNLSVSEPNFPPQGTLSKGIDTLPPAASLSKIALPSFSLSVARHSEMFPSPGGPLGRHLGFHEGSFETIQARDFSAEHIFIEIQRFLAATVEEEVWFELHSARQFAVRAALPWQDYQASYLNVFRVAWRGAGVAEQARLESV